MTTALFNMDSSIYHIQNFKWKGMTFNQISSIYKKNVNSGIMTKSMVNKPLPLKIYRKEIAINNGAPNNNCSRKRVSIDELNMPNGYIISVPTDEDIQIGLVNTLDIHYSNSKYDHPGTCVALSSHNVCLSQEQNAKTRVRSSGMIRKKYDINNTANNYNTSTSQYLTSRNRTFEQNQYNYVRKGSTIGKPGDSSTLGNEYSPQGLASSCTIMNYKPNNSQYAQQGGVTSSERLLRLKYNTITTNAGLIGTALGTSVGNAFAYGVSDEAYTVKTKMGSPTICVPTFHPTTGKQVNCKTHIYRY